MAAGELERLDLGLERRLVDGRLALAVDEEGDPLDARPRDLGRGDALAPLRHLQRGIGGGHASAGWRAEDRGLPGTAVADRQAGDRAEGIDSRDLIGLAT